MCISLSHLPLTHSPKRQKQKSDRERKVEMMTSKSRSASLRLFLILILLTCRVRVDSILSWSYLILVLVKLHSKVGSPMVAEIIWKLGHSEDNSKSHITLAQNPQFYRELYTSPSMYDANFVRESVYEYDEEKKEICVLTKNLNEVLPVFERVPPMVLDGIWFTNNTIIVRGLFLSFLCLSSTNISLDTRGNLLGQSKVSNSITAQELNHHRLKFSKTN
jgi:hypothetical protein